MNWSLPKQEIVEGYESLNYAAVIRKIAALADVCNKYVEEQAAVGDDQNGCGRYADDADDGFECGESADDLSEAGPAGVCGEN